MAIEFKKFPKMVYDASGSNVEAGEYSYIVVNNEEELEAAKAAGYIEQPIALDKPQLSAKKGRK